MCVKYFINNLLKNYFKFWASLFVSDGYRKCFEPRAQNIFIAFQLIVFAIYESIAQSTLYFSVLVLIYKSSSFLRLRRSICGYFYRKQEKRRILYLYNRLLKQRRTIRETMMKEAKYNFANRQIRLKANLFLIMRLKWPQYFNWLVKFHVGRRKCIICGELEDSNFVFCRNPFCRVSYCNECFNDIENSCWICNDTLAVEILLNFNDFFEEFSFV